MFFKVSFRRSVAAPPYSTSIGRASGAAKNTLGNNNLQTNMDYALDNCGPENGKKNPRINVYYKYNVTFIHYLQKNFTKCPLFFLNLGCGAKTCILIRDDQANQGNVNDPDVDDWLLINGAYKNPTLLNNNIPSNKYVMGSYFCGSGIGRDNRALGKYLN